MEESTSKCVKKTRPIYNKEDIKKCTAATRPVIKVKKPTLYNTIMRQRYQKRSLYYFTAGRRVDEKVLREIETNRSPFQIPKEIDDFSYRTKYRQDHAAALGKRKTYNYMTVTGRGVAINERMHISQEEIKLPGKSVVPDIDPEFYTVAAGRPIKDGFDIRQYLKDIQDCFRVRLTAALKYDDVYHIDQQLELETKRLEEIKSKIQLYMNSFEQFLSEDSRSSIELLHQAEIASKLSKEKREKFRQLTKEQNIYRTKLLILDDKWRTCKSYQKFLYLMSPHWWRSQYDHSYMHPSTDSTMSSISMQSAMTLAQQFLRDVAAALPPAIYFEDPTELQWILYQLERNNLLALLQCEELTPPALRMLTGLDKARVHFKRECKVLEEVIKELEQYVMFNEATARQLELKAKEITFGLFKQLIVDKHVLNICVAIEDCYETCISANDSNLNLSSMMKGLEIKQESLMAALDQLPTPIVVKATAICYKEDIRAMREAEQAGKLVKQIDNLLKSLKRSMEPQRKGKIPRPLVWRSHPPKELMEIEPPPRELTQEEADYIYFFTDACNVGKGPDTLRLLCKPLPRQRD